MPSVPVVNRPSLAPEPAVGTISVSSSVCSSPRFWNFVAMFSTVNGSTLTVAGAVIVAEPSPGAASPTAPLSLMPAPEYVIEPLDMSLVRPSVTPPWTVAGPVIAIEPPL